MNPVRAVAHGAGPSRRTCACAKVAREQSGVGLIEVMVAVLVLSIGFLAVGALLATSMSTNNSAMARSMATISSYSILDAMRADRAMATSGKYNNTVTANACPATTSTSSLAGGQISAWCDQLGSTLGAVSTTKGKVECATDGTCTVTITFDDSRAGAGGSDKQQIVTKAVL